MTQTSNTVNMTVNNTTVEILVSHLNEDQMDNLEFLPKEYESMAAMRDALSTVADFGNDHITTVQEDEMDNDDNETVNEETEQVQQPRKIQAVRLVGYGLPTLILSAEFLNTTGFKSDAKFINLNDKGEVERYDEEWFVFLNRCSKETMYKLLAWIKGVEKANTIPDVYVPEKDNHEAAVAKIVEIIASKGEGDLDQHLGRSKGQLIADFLGRKVTHDTILATRMNAGKKVLWVRVPSSKNAKEQFKWTAYLDAWRKAVSHTNNLDWGTAPNGDLPIVIKED